MSTFNIGKDLLHPNALDHIHLKKKGGSVFALSDFDVFDSVVYKEDKVGFILEVFVSRNFTKRDTEKTERSRGERRYKDDHNHMTDVSFAVR